MVIIHSEEVKSNFEGTIIDIETIGEFCNYRDSRHYQNIIPVIFGYIDKNGLKIHCTRRTESIEKLKNMIVTRILPQLRKPLYAFNCDFEKGALFHNCGSTIVFDGELNAKKYEKKKDVVASLGIENYDDPFYDDGKKCKQAWEEGDTKLSIRHNRSCLLKERDILLKRGHRTPDELVLYPINKKF